MNVLLWRWISLRHWRKSPGSHLLMTLLLGTGVAAFLGVRLANRASVAGFDVFTEALSGGGAASVEAFAGPIPDDQLGAIRRSMGLRPVVLLPVLESSAILNQGERVPVLGFDLLAARNLVNLDDSLQTFLPDSVQSSEAFQDALRGKRLVFLSQTFADAEGLRPGDSLMLTTESGPAQWSVGAILPDGGRNQKGPLIVDIATLQTQTGREGQVDRVEIFTHGGAPFTEVEQAEMSSALPPGVQMVSAEARGQTAARLSAAFRMNLSALSLLALLVSLYLILQALDAAVVRRREEIAILRALGVPTRVIRRSWWIEALFLGVIGSVMGVALGFWVARLSVQGVSRTLSSLYVREISRAALWSSGEVASALILGIGASVLAGWLPSRDAALTPPAQSLGRGGRALPIQLLDHPAYGLLAVFLALVFVRLPAVSLGGQAAFPLFGYFAATCFAVGFSILACTLLAPLARLTGRLGRHDPRVVYAASQLRQPSGRHKLAMAGLLIATAMAGGITLMVHSFSLTVTHWLQAQLQADLFVSAKGFQHAGSSARIPTDFREALIADPDVADAEWALYERISHQSEFVVLAGLSSASSPENQAPRIWVEAPVTPSPQSLRTLPAPGEPHPFWISEPAARKFSLHRGDRFTLQTPKGEVEAEVLGVYADYANEQGTFLTHADAVSDWFGELRTATLALTLKDGVSALEVRDRLTTRFPSLNIRDQTSLRDEVFQTFRQTFSVTTALKAIGVAVAVAGLVLSQMSLFTERRNELRTLKELGFTRRDLAACGAWESGMLTCCGSLAGLASALVLGGILIKVINPQSFGWTLRYAVPAGAFSQYFLLVLLAGSLAGALTGLRAGKLKVDHEA